MTRLPVAAALAAVLPYQTRVEAYDGSTAGPAAADVLLRVQSPKALSHLLVAPGELGMARAYVSGQVDVEAADHYTALRTMTRVKTADLSWSQRLQVLRSLGPEAVHWVEPPPQEVGAKRYLAGLRRHTARPRRPGDRAPLRRQQRVLRVGARAVDGLHLRGLPDRRRHAGAGAVPRSSTWSAASSGCSPGCGCSTSAAAGAAWRCTPPSTTASTSSRSRCRGSRRNGARRRWPTPASPTRSTSGSATTATSRRPASTRSARSGSPSTSGSPSCRRTRPSLAGKLAPQGRLLNHCITRPDDHVAGDQQRGFITRYVFPDGELPGVGRIVRELQSAGLEVRHEENLREHYAKTRQAWCDNLDAHWDEAVAEVGLGTARVWALYLAGSRIGFETNQIQLHQVLAVKTSDGASGMPLRGY